MSLVTNTDIQTSHPISSSAVVARQIPSGINQAHSSMSTAQARAICIDMTLEYLRNLEGEIHSTRRSLRQEAAEIKSRIDPQNPLHIPLTWTFGALLIRINPAPTGTDRCKMFFKAMGTLSIYLAKWLLSLVTCFFYPSPSIPADPRGDWSTAPSNPLPINIVETEERLNQMMNQIDRLSEQYRDQRSRATTYGSLENDPRVLEQLERIAEVYRS